MMWCLQNPIRYDIYSKKKCLPQIKPNTNSFWKYTKSTIIKIEQKMLHICNHFPIIFFRKHPKTKSNTVHAFPTHSSILPLKYISCNISSKLCGVHVLRVVIVLIQMVQYHDRTEKVFWSEPSSTVLRKIPGFCNSWMMNLSTLLEFM